VPTNAGLDVLINEGRIYNMRGDLSPLAETVVIHPERDVD